MGSSLFNPLDLAPMQYSVLAIAAVVLWILSFALYNVFLHPLSKFPGPKLWACSGLPYQFECLGGRCHLTLQRLFDKYGPIVRIAPQELAFNSAQAMRDISVTSHQNKARGGKKETLPKDERMYAEFGMKHVHMVQTLDPAVHARQRRMLNPAFSERAVREQEGMLYEHVDKFVAGIRREGAELGQAVDMKAWFNFTTFDITGELVFGESFHCLDNGAMHPWIQFLTGGIKAQMMMGFLLKIPGMSLFMPLLIPKKSLDDYAEHQALTKSKLEERLEQGQVSGKSDLIGVLLKDGMSNKDGDLSSQNDHISNGELIANTGLLMVGGSETSATLLAGALFHLTSNPKALKTLTTEIRRAFSVSTSITALAASKLPFLHAVIQESLRYYPPAAQQNMRKTPPEGAIIDGVFIPGNTYVGWPYYAAHHSASNFERPDEWLPERWLEGSQIGKKDSKDALVPFNLGPHGCLGITLAWAEIRLILCKLFWHFDVELCPGQERWQADQKVFMLWEKPPLKVCLRERN